VTAPDHPPGASPPTAVDVLDYWRGLGPQRWYAKDDAVDAQIRRMFLPLYRAAAGGLLADWEGDAERALALVIVLDQFPRNMFRGSAAAFAADPLARAAAGRAIARGFDRHFALPERRFLYMPFMHSEALADQERSCELCREAQDQDGLAYAEQHAGIIRRFGRFPHRNKLLARETTPQEQAFLDAGGFAG
jgi:uncharacterized protein (DUF924 family)